MKNLTYFLSAVLLGCMLLSSTACKKVLELESKENPSSNKFWQNERDARAGLMGGYSLLREALLDRNRYYVYGDVPANTFRITYYSDYAIHQLRDGSLDGSYYGGLEQLQDWSMFYKAIAQTNLLVAKIPGIPDNSFKPGYKGYYLGESYYLRSFIYFFISRVWGDVPLVLDPVEDVAEAKNYGREKQAIVLKQCLDDLDKAIPILPEQPISANDRGVRATRASALALKAHIYAWMKDYVKCEEATRDIVANPAKFGLTFITDSLQYQKMSIGRSTEAIFEISVNYDQNEGQDMETPGDYKWSLGYKTLFDPYVSFRKAKKADDVPWLVLEATSKKLYKDSGDLRKSIWFYQDPSDKELLMLKKYSNVIYKDGDVQKDAWFSNNILIFRLSDIMLLRAEALYKTSREGDARMLVNQIRSRAHLKEADPTLTGENFFRYLIYERHRELFAEGHAFWDELRTGTIEDFNPTFNGSVTPGNPKFGMNYWPIPRILFKDNLLMKQTPYWNGRI
ncbi:RagB/SusD family nutrient uptake outer membrane protein [Pseudoflavitalea sp. G-6-1-2]|uniref:RagB/SusD family nutrient uptake outer membrane protein n=1 Tax=Pseudoflavitalea sp. G-6-1-2 TaxID=2728841 RepID=UPI00146E940E|nr:RagB/SusD family nutrient uptake outer membrane protein [Pseudoflavitalea sp. G-6-1-2]NML21985.1 RagB/SusD family nutrient uptake outer membrane protein [Pseudoflavitalea sp. G-6-1-2]